MDALRTSYTPGREVSLRLTLGPLAQGRTDPTMQRDATGIWLALATAAGRASLHLRETARRDRGDGVGRRAPRRRSSRSRRCAARATTTTGSTRRGTR